MKISNDINCCVDWPRHSSTNQQMRSSETKNGKVEASYAKNSVHVDIVESRQVVMLFRLPGEYNPIKRQ